MLEVNAWIGLSTRTIAELAPAATVVAIDQWTESAARPIRVIFGRRTREDGLIGRRVRMSSVADRDCIG